MIYSIAGRKGHSGREPANRSGCSRIDYFTVSMHSPAVRAARGDNEWKCRSCDLIMHWKWPIIQCRWGVLHLYLNQRIIQSTLGGDVSYSTHSPTATRLRLCSSLCYRWKFLLAYLIRCYMARSNKVGNNSLRPEWDEVNDAIKPNSSTMSFILMMIYNQTGWSYKRRIRFAFCHHSFVTFIIRHKQIVSLKK